MVEYFSNVNIQFYILAYLAGSIPFGLILAKVFANVDIKQSGSKSIGATNVLRVVKDKNPKLAKKLAIATVVLDALKGVVVLLFAKYLGLPIETQWGITVLAVFGHCYSIFLGGDGGKGVATALGVLLVMIPVPTIIGTIFWFIAGKVLKISSLSSLIGLIVVVLSAIVLYSGLQVNSNAPLYIIAFVIFYKHIPNIVRLLSGKEQKVI